MNSNNLMTYLINEWNEYIKKTRIKKFDKRVELTNSLLIMNEMQIWQQIAKRTKIEKLTNDELNKNNEKYDEKNNDEKNDEKMNEKNKNEKIIKFAKFARNFRLTSNWNNTNDCY